MNAMKFSNNQNRNLLLGLALILCLLLLIFFSRNVFFTNTVFDDSVEEMVNEDLTNLEDVIGDDSFEEIADFEESLIEEDSNSNVFELEGVNPDYIQKRSLRVEVGDVYLMKESVDKGYDLYIEVVASDLILDEDKSKDMGNFYLRSPLLWQARLMLYRGEVVTLFVCDDEKISDTVWRTVYCTNINDLGENYFGQTLRLIYTDERFEDLEGMSPLAISKLERSYVFEIVIPKEFYSG